jgi:hypothetical protein
VPEATVAIIETGEDGTTTRRTVTSMGTSAGGTARITAPAPGVDLEVSASGYETLVLQGVAADAEVRLVRARR